MDKQTEKIIAILDDEISKELACYRKAIENYEKTRNPIKRLKNKHAAEMFEHHVAALGYAVIRIKRETKEDEG